VPCHFVCCTNSFLISSITDPCWDSCFIVGTHSWNTTLKTLGGSNTTTAQMKGLSDSTATSTNQGGHVPGWSCTYQLQASSPFSLVLQELKIKTHLLIAAIYCLWCICITCHTQ
jgi:hypothetical protein